ncbi:hypothetical protein ACP70R_001529 [Stipagrostis hirtigluma subsp. patula]
MRARPALAPVHARRRLRRPAVAERPRRPLPRPLRRRPRGAAGRVQRRLLPDEAFRSRLHRVRAGDEPFASRLDIIRRATMP